MLKLVAAMPLLGMGLKVPQGAEAETSKMQEYVGGGEFLYGNDAGRVLFRARVAASVFSLLLAAMVFAAAYEMFGAGTGLIALVLCVFEPTLLAHGALVTTDMAASCMIFAAMYALYRYEKRPGIGRLLVVGVAVGLALAAKFSSLLLLPMFGVCLLLEWLKERRRLRAGGEVAQGFGGWKRVLGWVGAVLVAWVVLWGFYRFTYAARPGGLQLAPTLAAYAAMLGPTGKAGLIMAAARMHLLPEGYLYGLVDLQIFGGALPSFLLGTVHPGPTKMYFPVAFVIKSTLAVLALLVGLPFVARGKGGRYWRELVFLLVPVVVYLAVSLNAPENIGVRHILPVFPFVMVLAGWSAGLIMGWGRVGAAIAGVLLVVHVGSSLRAFPDYLPYANEAFGGPARTYRVLTDSNVDWGQTFLKTSDYLRKNKVEDCWYAVGLGVSFVDHYRLNCRPLPSGFGRVTGMQLPVIPPTVHGTILVSAVEASGLFWGNGVLNPYGELLKRRPDDMIGDAVLVFRGDVALPLASAEAHSSASSFLLRRGRLEEALGEANLAVAGSGVAPDIRVNLGAVLLTMGRKAEAEAAFGEARRLAGQYDPEGVQHTDQVIAGLESAVQSGH